MTATTETIRSQGFMPLESEIPPGVTLAQWRATRRRRVRGVRRRSLLRRRAQRPVVAA
jgi:hypothetical protein